jgi:hypothetical protein
VGSLFRGHYNIPLIHRDAGGLFLDNKLAGITDPEEKRKTIGASFPFPHEFLGRTAALIINEVREPRRLGDPTRRSTTCF